jgi:ankyrin repeat protein
MKHLLLTTIAAVVLVGCSKPPPPDISIHDAAHKCDIEAVKQHLAAGTDANAKDEDGVTPLHYAAIAGQKEYVEVAELLIAAGADVNATDSDGNNTPLDLAFGETADLLRKHGGKTREELKAAGK